MQFLKLAYMPAVPVLIFLYVVWHYTPWPLPASWSERELVLIESLSLAQLSAPPPDPGNAFGDNPAAAELGHRLFFDQRLSSDGSVSCATCHQPEFAFTDQLRTGVGVGEGDRNTMGLLGVAYSPWFFWDGRKDSLWAQALEPLENPLEHATNRMQVVHVLAADPNYRTLYESVFGPLPDLDDEKRFPAHASPLGHYKVQQAWFDMAEPDRQQVSHVFVNIGKALAAYQRLLMPGPAPFDVYVEQLSGSRVRSSDVLTDEQLAGLRLFIGKATCVDCHNGPLLTNNAFHNTGVLSAPGHLPSLGRTAGLRMAQDDPFNCMGEFSDSEPMACVELRFARGGEELLGAQRTPSLRNLSLTAPYMHAGQLDTLSEVIAHYNTAGLAVIGHNEVEPLRLRAVERQQLEAFLRSLDGPPATDRRWLVSPWPEQ